MSDYQFLEGVFSKLLAYKRIEDIAPGFHPELRVKMKEDLPEALRRAWELAVYESECNFQPSPYGGRYFTAGGRGGWHGMVFGQDTVGAGLLAWNRLYPELMRSQLRTYTLARLNIGFMGPEDWVVENCEKAVPTGTKAWIPDSREFIKRYGISPALNRTGQDVGWLWTAGDLFDICGDRMDWAWLYSMGRLFFEHFYHPFFDETDGLYFGQASFIDVGTRGYPPAFGLRTQKSRNAAVWIKAASTNALYVRGMDVMAHAARMLEMPEQAEKWKARADALRSAMKERLRFEDGSFSYFMHRNGVLEERREGLGAAFCVLADVVTGDEARAALALDKLPVSQAGIPCFYPFYEPDERYYHNKAAWPHVSTCYFAACEKALGESFLRQDATQLATAITVPEGFYKAREMGMLEDYQTGTFKEIICWKDAQPSGVSAQTWTLSAFMNLCLRKGWLDVSPGQHRFGLI